jgi:hypothetical protein
MPGRRENAPNETLNSERFSRPRIDSETRAPESVEAQVASSGTLFRR